MKDYRLAFSIPVVCALVLSLNGCKKSSETGAAGGIDDTVDGSAGGSGASAADSGVKSDSGDGSTSDSTTDSPSDAPKDSTGDSTGDSSVDGSPGDSSIGDSASDTAQQEDSGTVIDAPIKEAGQDKVCDFALAWMTSSVSFDSSVTPSAFASSMADLIQKSTPHIITIADRNEGNSWTMTSSATSDNGSYQQMFPGDHPTSFTGMTRLTDSFKSTTAQASGWLHVTDLTNTVVWIPLQQVETSANYGDAYCQSLSKGRLTATIPSSASSVAISTSSGATTLGALLGTPSLPAGWPIAFTFDATVVQVSWK